MSNNKDFTVQNFLDVKGNVAVVTGGGTGIGLMEALDGAISAHGSSLQNGGELHTLTADIRDKASIEALVKTIGEKEKCVDVLVNDAGVDGPTSSVEKGDESAEALKEELWKVDWKEWENVYSTNVIGYYNTTVAFLPLLAASTAAKKGHSAAVINISSISGITRATQHHYAYNVSKAATIQLTELLAQELTRPVVKVRVNSIAPGIFPSEMTTEGSGPGQKSHIPAGEEYREKKTIPAGRPGRDIDMAQACLVLATDQYIGGQTLVVDGGYLLRHP